MDMGSGVGVLVAIWVGVRAGIAGVRVALGDNVPVVKGVSVGFLTAGDSEYA
jgi:hypothetical protein